MCFVPFVGVSSILVAFVFLVSFVGVSLFLFLLLFSMVCGCCFRFVFFVCFVCLLRYVEDVSLFSNLFFCGISLFGCLLCVFLLWVFNVVCVSLCCGCFIWLCVLFDVLIVLWCFVV